MYINRNVCPHANKYYQDTTGTYFCPDCGSMRIHGFLNKRTGERLGGAISGELADDLRRTDDLGEWEQWIQNPGAHNETRQQYQRRQRDLNRAFSSYDGDYGEA